MESRKSRLDRFISVHTGINRRDVRLLIAQKRILINSEPATDINQVIGQFDQISLDDELLQNNQPIYIMMHKPVGVVSATVDEQHKTVLDLLDCDNKEQLHIVGRLDLNTSGLLLLTNNGEWSRNLTSPEHKVAKRYHVTLENPITDDYAPAFAAGMYFPFEDITTQPAELVKTGEREAQVSLTEGKYHQIKRMFGRFRNPVIGLHREAIGGLELDCGLAPGESRELTMEEVELLS
ncbi:16S rRNA pseudouridine(516) synthase [Neptuniibacter sp.]|uniref:pseudouridine synthase n=1 Tax=Neptuniibacter sp. TaxID=1962643 RepID=UPI00260B995D|nr:16S rRNA pseudouridine(516) synthase [Neptuniibacter sp.]MCP4596807.1 16S rRNA pseudouridine(516) synthase [Neptuniibacter sp.]